MLARVFGAQPSVLGADIVVVETDLSRGLYSFTVVGLPDKAVEEARDRISAAIKNSGFESPKSKNHKIVISLAPADQRKEGPLFDLPMAISYLAAAGELRAYLTEVLFIGELGLDGTVRPVRGALRVAQAARAAHFKEILVPKENAREAALIQGITITPVATLIDAVRHLDTKREDQKRLPHQSETALESEWTEECIRFEDIKGQESAKRGLLIAAAGRHNALMIGPPGTGKTMLARATQSILPPLSRDESLEVTAIHSYAGMLTSIHSQPPFRAPHHTASHTSLVGGGTYPRPGEVTLAHKGVLFLDEFPEFERRSLDALRQPLEDRVVSISRVQGTATFPADFILLAAMNPHRGTYSERGHEAKDMLDAYRKKISGPIMDRIDLWLQVNPVPFEALATKNKTAASEETKKARELVLRARALQRERFSSEIKTNAHMGARDIESHVPLTETVTKLLGEAAQKLNLSPRGYHRLIKVARTIADLDDARHVEVPHVLEALQYRGRL